MRLRAQEGRGSHTEHTWGDSRDLHNDTVKGIWQALALTYRACTPRTETQSQVGLWRKFKCRKITCPHFNLPAMICGIGGLHFRKATCQIDLSCSLFSLEQGVIVSTSMQIVPLYHRRSAVFFLALPSGLSMQTGAGVPLRFVHQPYELRAPLIFVVLVVFRVSKLQRLLLAGAIMCAAQAAALAAAARSAKTPSSRREPDECNVAVVRVTCSRASGTVIETHLARRRIDGLRNCGAAAASARCSFSLVCIRRANRQSSTACRRIARAAPWVPGLSYFFSSSTFSCATNSPTRRIRVRSSKVVKGETADDRTFIFALGSLFRRRAG